MGYMRHHSIVVSSWNDKIFQAHAYALHAFLDDEGGPVAYVTEITPEAVNGYRSFMVAPDGSKEGWRASNEGDQCREAFKAYLRKQAYDDGSTSVAWVEVQFYDDEGVTKIVDSSDHEREKVNNV